jgi:hypothetical protein
VLGQPGQFCFMFAFSPCQHGSRHLLFSFTKCMSCLQLLKPKLPLQIGASNEASTGGQEAVGWDGQLGANPTSSIVLTVFGCLAAGNEVTR